MTRKRKRTGALVASSSKRVKRVQESIPPQPSTNHPTLSFYYPQVLSLRHFLISKLPKAARSRRRKIAHLGRRLPTSSSPNDRPPASDLSFNVRSTADAASSHLLDSVLVCAAVNTLPEPSQSTRAREFDLFSQQVTLTAGESCTPKSSCQSDLLDFAIWLLFNRLHRHANRPPHLLCHGYQRAQAPRSNNENHGALAGIPGIIARYPNNNVSTLKNGAWSSLLTLLGKDGDRIMLDILLHCGLFALCSAGNGNCYQLSGIALSEMTPLELISPPVEGAERDLNKTSSHRPVHARAGDLHPPGSIHFVRSRMLYARPALNAKAEVTFGLRHIHALNRYSDSANMLHTVRMLKYVFPRQFKLHNAFTSNVDPTETVQPFKDYTLREQEIARSEVILKRQLPALQNAELRVPRRLRGQCTRLVQDLQRRNVHCAYYELLKHYCPTFLDGREAPRGPQSRPDRQIGSITRDHHSEATVCCKPDQRPSAIGPNASSIELATSHAQVSAFSRACLANIVPNAFWGDGEAGQSNKTIVMHHVDRFIKLRRFELLTLHKVFQGIQIHCISWLARSGASARRISQSDTTKRKELFLELLYYVFDSMLIPLIRSNFHVTESNAHQNRLLYFRHDVWRALTEPALTEIKGSIFEELHMTQARKLLDARKLGFSQIRLLPKASGFRPIANLRRRVTKLQHGRVALGRSINSIMRPVLDVFDLERRRVPSLVGNALFSVGDMYPKLKAFQRSLQTNGWREKRLYFVKADAKSCFDTIPQASVMQLMASIASEDVYRISRHSEIKRARSDHYRLSGEQKISKPGRKFVSKARSSTDFAEFDEWLVQERMVDKRDVVFIDGVVQQAQQKEAILGLLGEHVQKNIVKIGKKFFRQKAGIPQGSVLSSLLCNLFYAEMERECFWFLKKDESLLLRLIDDFLLITTKKADAIKFLQRLHNGVEKYGIEVNAGKSLANFAVEINGQRVAQCSDARAFPYCGNMIDMRTLEISKDRSRRRKTCLADSLTIEPSKVAGRTFYRKALQAFKIQTHKMLLDTTFNRPARVLQTVYESLIEVGMKFFRYIKGMAKGARPQMELLVGTIGDLTKMAQVLVKAKHKVVSTGQMDEYQCTVSKGQIAWLVSQAFRHVLHRKQSRYGELLRWLEEGSRNAMPSNKGKEMFKLHRIVRRGNEAFAGYKY